MSRGLLIYGSYGYTGALIVETAIERGLSPTLAGRRAKPVERQATDYGLDHRVFSLNHPDVIDAQIETFDAVLHCAGPFGVTSEPIVEACLRTNTNYLDITGAIDVFEAIAERDRTAEKAGVALLPGVGFDVVPTDCLAAHLENQLPSATQLRLAIDTPSAVSGGSLKSIVRVFSRSGAARIDGEIRTVPFAWKSRQVDFGRGPTHTVTIPWGDVMTAYHTTGIPNIETYLPVPPVVARVLSRLGTLAPLFDSAAIQSALRGLIDATVSGPTAAERAQISARVWGEVENAEGARFAAQLETPGPYDLTARTAVESAQRVLDGDLEPGFQTPGSAFGSDFALGFDGVDRKNGTPSQRSRTGQSF